MKIMSISFLPLTLHPSQSQFPYSSSLNYARAMTSVEAICILRTSVLETQYCTDAATCRLRTKAAVLWYYMHSDLTEQVCPCNALCRKKQKGRVRYPFSSYSSSPYFNDFSDLVAIQSDIFPPSM